MGSNKNDATSEVFCIDPALTTPELESYNHIAKVCPYRLSYHLPAFQSMAPTFERERKYKPRGIVVLGSSCSVYDENPWQRELEKWLAEKIAEKIPVLGMCYGHQLVAHIFGAKLGYLNENRKSFKGFREIDICEKSPLVLSSQKGFLVASHKEEVKEKRAESKFSEQQNIIGKKQGMFRNVGMFRSIFQRR